MTKEAHVFVRFGVPWVATLCPDCNDRVNPDDRFCAHCGQALSFDLYRAVLKGTLKPKRTPKRNPRRPSLTPSWNATPRK